MRLLKVAFIFLGLCGCDRPSPPGPPVRLATGDSDTIIINSRWPQRLPVHAFDARGRAVAQAPIRFERVTGAALPVTGAGAVTCAGSGDLAVRATLDNLTTLLYVKCRLVESVRIPGPIQFVLGDSALSEPQTIPVGVYDADGRDVSLFNIKMMVPGDVATLRGTTLYPRVPGASVVSAHVGDQDGGTGVHVYQRLDSLNALDTLLRVHPQGRLVAAPLRLEAGARYRQRVPPGHWQFVVLPTNGHSVSPIRFGVDGAVCTPNFLNDPRRLECQVGPGGGVVVFRSPGREEPAVAEGYLLVKEAGNPNPRRFLPRVAATLESLACVTGVLEERGYGLQPTPGEPRLLQAERRGGRLGTKARREVIEVRFVPDSAGATLRGRAWAVDSFRSTDGRLGGEAEVVVEALEETLSDGRAALQQCGRA